MTSLGPFELNIIKRKIIEKLYFFSPRTLTWGNLKLDVDDPQEEDFNPALAYLEHENIVEETDGDYTLTAAGMEIFTDQGKFAEYFPLADVPRTNFG